MRQGIEFRQLDNQAEIQVFVSNACEGDLGATGPPTVERPPEIPEALST